MINGSEELREFESSIAICIWESGVQVRFAPSVA